MVVWEMEEEEGDEEDEEEEEVEKWKGKIQRGFFCVLDRNQNAREYHQAKKQAHCAIAIAISISSEYYCSEKKKKKQKKEERDKKSNESAHHHHHPILSYPILMEEECSIELPIFF